MKLEDLIKNKVYLYENTAKPDIKSDKLDKIHNVLIIDISGSMYYEIPQLKDSVKEVVKTLSTKDNNYISIILFSGHNSSRIVVSGELIVNNNYKSINSLVDKYLVSDGLTVFSEPLECVSDIILMTDTFVDKHNIVLFTDGCPVPTQWSLVEEVQKTIEIVEFMTGNPNVFVNAIGFSNYYDRDFLNNIVKTSNNGILVHIDDITDYERIVSEMVGNVQKAQKLYDILETDGKIVNLQNGNISSRAIARLGDKYAIIGANKFFLNSEQFELKEELNESTTDDWNQLMLSVSKYYLDIEDFESFDSILRFYGDIKLYEQTKDSFSLSEKARTSNLLLEHLANKTLRFKKGKKVLPVELEDNNLCLLEILLKIFEKGEIYLNPKEYRRLTLRKVKEPTSLRFISAETSDYIKCIAFDLASTALNINVSCIEQGVVEDTVSGLKRLAATIKKYTLVNSGSFNVKTLFVKIPEELTYLMEHISHTKKDDGYIINLASCKIINKNLLKKLTLNDIVSKLYNIEDLKVQQKVLNKRKKEMNIFEEKGIDLTDEFIMKKLNIDSNGFYNPVLGEVDTDRPIDKIASICCDWKVKYPVSANEKKYIKDFEPMSNSQVLQKLSDVKKELAKLRLEINLVKFAYTLSSRPPCLWETIATKKKEENDKNFDYNKVVGGEKTVNTKSVGDIVFIEEKYMLLNPCN